MPQLEFHQLDRRLEHLRLRHPARFRRLLASLSESGQQTPIIVIPCDQRYLVIDGYQRIAALQRLRRDTVEALVWEMSEREALLLARSLRMNGEPETALEQGWLLQEMESRLGCSMEELARRFDRSATWVARRLALVEILPESVQRQVREGRIAPQIAMRYLTPVARLDLDQCERCADLLAAALDDAASRGAVPGMARRAQRAGARAHFGGAGSVSESPATTADGGNGRAGERSAADGGHRQAGTPAGGGDSRPSPVGPDRTSHAAAGATGGTHPGTEPTGTEPKRGRATPSC